MEEKAEGQPNEQQAEGKLVALFLGGLIALAGVATLIFPPPPKPAKKPDPDDPKNVAEIHVSEGIGLHVEADALRTGGAFEFRFDEAVAERRLISFAAEESPVRFEPAAKGVFIWKTPRSGNFVPEEPLALGQSYRVTAEIEPLSTEKSGEKRLLKLDATVVTPSMQLNGHSWPAYRLADAPSLPEIQLLFNVPVSADSAKERVRFVRSDGQRVEAKVSRAMKEDFFPSYLSKTRSLRTWKEDFYAARGIEPPAGENEEEEDPESVRNRLVVSPKEPLGTGAWKLEIKGKLPSKDEAMSLGEDAAVEVGEVLPFEVKGIVALNGLESGKQIRIDFSKQLSAEFVEGGKIGDFVQVTPQPEGLEIKGFGRQIFLQGSFGYAQEYAVEVKPGIPAEEKFQLEAAAEESVFFQPLEPGIHLPAYAGHQFAWGRREFNLRHVNLSDFKVEGKLLSNATIIHALRAYRNYEQGFVGNQQVDFDLIPGRPIYLGNFPGGGGDDLAHDLSISWDELLVGYGAGTLFLSAEGTGVPMPVPGAADSSAKKTRLGAQALVQMTDLGMVVKSNHESVFAYVFSMSLGTPQPDVRVHLMDDHNQSLAVGTTNRDGAVEFPKLIEGEWLVAEKDADLHAVHLPETEGNVWLHGFGLDYRPWLKGYSQSELFAFTDRPVYKPGETVHAKAILRDWAGGAFDLPDAEIVTLEIRDSDGSLVLSEVLLVSEEGSAQHSFELPFGKLGTYQATFLVREKRTDHYFEVQGIRRTGLSSRLEDAFFRNRGKERASRWPRFLLPRSGSFQGQSALVVESQRRSLSARGV